jgi:GDPmannose 4,6-dehydratase
VRALITGAGGQDGFYLAAQLLEEGFEVHGVVRDTAREVPGVELHADAPYGELIAQTAPQHVYHLAAPSFVPDSWSDAAGTLQAIAGRTSELLEAVSKDTRVVLAGSREMFGDAEESPQTERSRRHPNSPYGVAKLAAYELTRVLRAANGLHASTAILYNHESPRRPERFVTRRVTRGAAAVKLGLTDHLRLGSLDAVRDWSSAADMMRGLRLMAAAEQPGDYILASGTGRTVRELARTAFAVVGLDAEEHISLDEDATRPVEANAPVGDPSLARERLGWQPRQSFEDLIREMVEHDLAELASR